MKTSTIIVLAFVAMVFGTFMLAEPTSALPRRDEGRCPSWVCQSDAFLRCCSSYSYSPGSCNDISRHYMFDCCPNHDFNGCVWYVLILHPFMNPRVSSYLICYDIFDIKSKSAWSLVVILFKNVLHLFCSLFTHWSNNCLRGIRNGPIKFCKTQNFLRFLLC